MLVTLSSYLEASELRAGGRLDGEVHLCILQLARDRERLFLAMWLNRHIMHTVTRYGKADIPHNLRVDFAETSARIVMQFVWGRYCKLFVFTSIIRIVLTVFLAVTVICPRAWNS